jgi:hypothetical protein
VRAAFPCTCRRDGRGAPSAEGNQITSRNLEATVVGEPPSPRASQYDGNPRGARVRQRSQQRCRRACRQTARETGDVDLAPPAPKAKPARAVKAKRSKPSRPKASKPKKAATKKKKK